MPLNGSPAALGFRFRVIIPDEDSTSNWTSCSDLVDGTEIRRLSLVTYPSRAIRYPGEADGGEVTLRRGAAADADVLFSWRELIVSHSAGKIVNGAPLIRDVVIQSLTFQGKVARSILLKEAWPSKLVYSGWDAQSSSFLFESLTLIYDEIEPAAYDE
jgi:phage tail-like protein